MDNIVCGIVKKIENNTNNLAGQWSEVLSKSGGNGLI